MACAHSHDMRLLCSRRQSGLIQKTLHRRLPCAMEALHQTFNKLHFHGPLRFHRDLSLKMQLRDNAWKIVKNSIGSAAPADPSPHNSKMSPPKVSWGSRCLCCKGGLLSAMGRRESQEPHPPAQAEMAQDVTQRSRWHWQQGCQPAPLTYTSCGWSPNH